MTRTLGGTDEADVPCRRCTMCTTADVDVAVPDMLLLLSGAKRSLMQRAPESIGSDRRASAAGQDVCTGDDRNVGQNSERLGCNVCV